LNVGVYFLLRKIEKVALLSPSIWDDALIKATRKPLTLILWVTGATLLKSKPCCRTIPKSTPTPR
ncbi:MAG: hypothetical protein Q8J70_02235, partial [Thiobacillus sp.]|nr:hypothetical protein [Thiobacillus sp.]